MNNLDNIVTESQLTSNKTEMQKTKSMANKEYKLWPNAISLGTIAGFLMGAYLLTLQIVGAGDSIGLKFFKYLFLLFALGMGISAYRKYNPTSSFFKNGIAMGAYITIISALVVVVIDFVISIISPDLSFNKFNLEINSPGDFLTTIGAIFFEILVFGMIGTFIFLQYLKGKPKNS